MRRIHNFLAVLTCIALVCSCESKSGDVLDIKKHDMADPELGLTRDDYNKNMYVPKNAAAAKAAADTEPPIPDIAEILAAPKPPKLGEAKLVSIAVTDDVPLKDVLIELARLADVDIEVDSGITGGITFRAKDRPFNEVVERISNLAGLRYSMKNNVLRVERDTPYIQEYSLNFLNLDRNSSGSIHVGGNSGGSNTSGSSGGGATNGTSTTGSTSGSIENVASKSDSDFWKQFDDGVKQILSYSESKRISNVEIATQPVAPTAPTAVAPGASGGSAAGQPPAVGAAPAAAPAPAPVAAAPAAAAGGAKSPLEGTFYIINKQASTMTVSANERQHEMIKLFLNMIEANTSSQVLIEAKVLEVTLSDEYQTGINWSKFGNNHVSFNGDLSTVAATATKVTTPTITLLNNDVLGTGIGLSAAVQLLDEFGTTRALSSPRLHAMNNQQAVLSFAEGIVSFNVQINTTQAVLGSTGQVVTPAQVNVTSTQQTTPIGIILTLQPSINSTDETITLSVRPTLTKLTKYVDDPGFEISKANALSLLTANSAASTALEAVSSQIPQVETRELDSIVKIKSGQTLVIGGLIQDNTTNSEAGVPGVSEVPLFGNLFKSVDKTTTKQELVIFIRATIVDPSGGASKADKILYQKFGNDPRPIEF